MKVIGNYLIGFLVLISLPFANSDKLEEIKVTTVHVDTITTDDDLISKKIDTLEQTKYEIIQLQKEMGIRK